MCSVCVFYRHSIDGNGGPSGVVTERSPVAAGEAWLGLHVQQGLTGAGNG